MARAGRPQRARGGDGEQRGERARARICRSGEAAAVRAHPRSWRARRSRPRRGRARAAPDLRPGEDRGDAPAVRHAAAARVAGALIPGEHEEAARAELADHGGQRAGEKAVGGTRGAIVTVVAEVRRDPREGRAASPRAGPRPARRSPPGESSARCSTRRPGSRRRGCASSRSRPRRRPRSTGGGRPRGTQRQETLAASSWSTRFGAETSTRGAVGGHAVRRAAREREVVGQRWMGDRVALRRRPVAPREGVHVWRSGVADHAAVLLVLHHQEITCELLEAGSEAGGPSAERSPRLRRTAARERARGEQDEQRASAGAAAARGWAPQRAAVRGAGGLTP